MSPWNILEGEGEKEEDFKRLLERIERSLLVKKNVLGFEDIVATILQTKEENTYPYYNIRKTNTGFSIEIAVAGFTKEDLSVYLGKMKLIVIGEKPNHSEGDFLIKGIATRSFKKVFILGEHVKVESEVRLSNGILYIDLIKPKEQEGLVKINIVSNS